MMEFLGKVVLPDRYSDIDIVVGEDGAQHLIDKHLHRDKARGARNV